MDSGVEDVDPLGRKSARAAVRLEYTTIGWNVFEAAVAVGAGVVAGSVALVAFGLDSAIEVVSATVVLVHLRATLVGAEPNAARQRRALRTVAFTFFALAAYVSVDAVVALLRADRPSASVPGLVVTGAAVLVMPTLAWAKRRTARTVGACGHQSSAVLLNADAAETLLCAALSLATLIGVGANAAFGWWWADPLAGLVVVCFAVSEGREAWVGELLDDH